MAECDRCGCKLTSKNRVNNLCQTCNEWLTATVKLEKIEDIYNQWKETDDNLDIWVFKKIGEVLNGENDE